MAQIELRERVHTLRKGGHSINEIVRITKAPKSTVGYWCRDIALSRAQMERLANKSIVGGKIGILRAAEKKRAIRKANVETLRQRGSKDIGHISSRDLFILGLALYWGEGYKSGNEECGLTNSNPDIIRAFIFWLKKVYGIRTTDLILRVSVNHIHKGRIRKIESHWSEITHVPHSQFTNASLIKTKSRKTYANSEEHFGTLRVKVRRGTILRRRIMGSIEQIGKQVTQ